MIDAFAVPDQRRLDLAASAHMETVLGNRFGSWGLEEPPLPR